MSDTAAKRQVSRFSSGDATFYHHEPNKRHVNKYKRFIREVRRSECGGCNFPIIITIRGTGARRDSFTRRLRDFVAAVDSIARAEIGVPAPTPAREVVDHSFSHSHGVQFAAFSDHDTCQAHPAHRKGQYHAPPMHPP